MNIEFYQKLFASPFRESKTHFVQLVETATKANDSEAICRALLDLAFAEIHMGSIFEALKITEQVIELSELSSLNEFHMEGRLWREVARHFTNSTNGENNFVNLASEAKSYGKTDLASIAYALRARELKRDGCVDDSKAMVDTALEALANVQDPYVRVIVLRLTGMLLRNIDNLETAIQHLEESRLIAENFGLTSQLARTLTALGSTYVAEQRPKEGLEELLRAKDIYEELEIHDWYVAETLLNIAMLHDIAEEPALGIPYAHTAVMMFEEFGDSFQAAMAENVLGDLQCRIGDLDVALASYTRSTSKYRLSTEVHHNAPLPLANAANILIKRGSYEEALQLLTEAKSLALKSSNNIVRQHVYASLGAFYDVEGNPLKNYRLAEEYLNEGYAITDVSELNSTLILDELARFHEHHKNFELALYYTKQGNAVREKVRSANMQRHVIHLEVRQRITESQKTAEIEHLRNVELKAAQTLLVESERLASIGQLTAGIAHEINNPVTFITSSIGPLRRDLAEYESLNEAGKPVTEIREEIQELLSAIENGARRTAEIVKSLRTFSRLDEADVKQADIVSGIESTLTLLGTRIKGEVRIEKNYQQIPMIECRPGQINQVIMNILSNALDAVENVSNPVISISVSSVDSDHVQIKIQDNGPGISDEVKSRMFEPFFTTKEVGKGTGLGLSISHGIIERHGGKILVSNQPGACFSVVLPITQN